MKKNLFFIAIACILFSFPTTAQDHNHQGDHQPKIVHEVFSVYGNCGMCKKTIEGSLTGVDGIKQGIWDMETDQMTVSFDPEVITLVAIKQLIAAVGYDSDTHRAKDEVYNSLPGCCQYDRPVN